MLCYWRYKLHYIALKSKPTYYKTVCVGEKLEEYDGNLMGWFTPWTMKSDHGRWPFPMARLHGPTFMVRFLGKSIYKAFGPLTRCKPNVNQEEWSCTKSECVDFFIICPKRVVLKKYSSLTILLSSLVFTSLHFLFSLDFTLNFSKHGCNGGDVETYFARIHVFIQACGTCCGHSSISFARRM